VSLTHSSTWRPVQGPWDERPGALAGTGHIVGTVYASHYWGDVYRVTAAHANGAVTVQRLLAPDVWGVEMTHRTRLHPDGAPDAARDDHPVSQACGYRWECRNRAEQMAGRSVSG